MNFNKLCSMDGLLEQMDINKKLIFKIYMLDEFLSSVKELLPILSEQDRIQVTNGIINLKNWLNIAKLYLKNKDAENALAFATASLEEFQIPEYVWYNILNTGDFSGGPIIAVRKMNGAIISNNYSIYSQGSSVFQKGINAFVWLARTLGSNDYYNIFFPRKAHYLRFIIALNYFPIIKKKKKVYLSGSRIKIGNFVQNFAEHLEVEDFDKFVILLDALCDADRDLYDNILSWFKLLGARFEHTGELSPWLEENNNILKYIFGIV